MLASGLPRQSARGAAGSGTWLFVERVLGFFLACQPGITEYQTSLLAVNLVDETLPAKVLEVRLRSALYGIRLANLALGPMAGCDRQWQRLVLDVLKWTQGAVPC